MAFGGATFWMIGLGMEALEIGFGLISRYSSRQWMRGFFLRLQLLFQLVSTLLPEVGFRANGGTILRDLLLRAFYPISEDHKVAWYLGSGYRLL